MAGRSKRITQADLDRLTKMVRVLGIEVVAVEVTPGKVRIITTKGEALSDDLTVDQEDPSLDAELQAFRGKHGYGDSGTGGSS